MEGVFKTLFIVSVSDYKTRSDQNRPHTSILLDFLPFGWQQKYFSICENKKKKKQPNLLCVTYAPKRIHIEAISEPNINIKPMKSQTRAPAGNIKTSENHVDYYPQWQMIQATTVIQYVILLKAQRERAKLCTKNKINQNLPSLVKHILVGFPTC